MKKSNLTSEVPQAVEKRQGLSLADEGVLVQQAQSDPLAFGELFDHYHKQIFHYILHRIAIVHIAHELTSNTFYKAITKIWQFKWRKIPFSAWLYRIACNEVNEYYRKHKDIRFVPIEKIKNIVDDPNTVSDRELDEAEKQLAQNKLFLQLHEALLSLHPRYQEVVTLKYFEKMRIVEIAQIMGRPQGTVKSLLHRAHKQLRTKLNPSLMKEVNEA